ncbi:hypothetical protein C6502_08150 [Candidatus Poribacteria bacterium]|nr:MAG: hypothetical protein C6502_08150 [Candidatus Poribacteria bacterium]
MLGLSYLRHFGGKDMLLRQLQQSFELGSMSYLTAIEARCVAANKRSIRLIYTLGFELATIVPPSPGQGTFKNRILPEHIDI